MSLPFLKALIVGFNFKTDCFPITWFARAVRVRSFAVPYPRRSSTFQDYGINKNEIQQRNCVRNVSFSLLQQNLEGIQVQRVWQSLQNCPGFSVVHRAMHERQRQRQVLTTDDISTSRLLPKLRTVLYFIWDTGIDMFKQNVNFGSWFLYLHVYIYKIRRNTTSNFQSQTLSASSTIKPVRVTTPGCRLIWESELK